MDQTDAMQPTEANVRTARRVVVDFFTTSGTIWLPSQVAGDILIVI